MTILNSIKIEDKNTLKLMIKNNIKKKSLKSKLIYQLKVAVSTSHLFSINVVDLTTINSKSIKKRYKTLIFFNSTFIASQFSKTTSFNLNSFCYTAQTTILTYNQTLKQRFKFNNVLFIISLIFKFFINRYNAILSFEISNIKKLNINFEKTMIKAFQIVDVLLNRIYNYLKKINVRLSAIRNNVNDAIKSNLLKIKNAVFKSIIKFITLFTK